VVAPCDVDILIDRTQAEAGKIVTDEEEIDAMRCPLDQGVSCSAIVGEGTTAIGIGGPTYLAGSLVTQMRAGERRAEQRTGGVAVEALRDQRRSAHPTSPRTPDLPSQERGALL
jgi:hypothetical protein